MVSIHCRSVEDVTCDGLDVGKLRRQTAALVAKSRKGWNLPQQCSDSALLARQVDNMSFAGYDGHESATFVKSESYESMRFVWDEG